MELDDLKSIWKTKQTFEPKQDEEIATMLRGQSNSIISKLKRSVWFELIFTIVCGIGLGIYAFTLPESNALMWTIISLLVLFVSYLFYYVKKIILLNQFDSSSENLKESLEHLLERLTVYLNFYKRSYAILYPVYFILGLLFGALERGMDDFLHHISQPKIILYLVGLAGIFFFCTIWITNWYLKKLYGNHLEKLKELLKELQG